MVLVAVVEVVVLMAVVLVVLMVVVVVVCVSRSAGLGLCTKVFRPGSFAGVCVPSPSVTATRECARARVSSVPTFGGCRAHGGGSMASLQALQVGAALGRCARTFLRTSLFLRAGPCVCSSAGVFGFGF